MLKKVLVFGGGQQGNLVATSLILRGYDVTIADVKFQVPNSHKIPFVQLDINDVKNDMDFRKHHGNYDLIISALPAIYGPLCVKMAVLNGIDCVDLSFTDASLFQFDDLAKRNGCVVLADCGLAPGLPNLIIGDAIRQYGTLDVAQIHVGGVAANEYENDLGYAKTWSIPDLCSEYTRPARMVINHTEVVYPAPLFQDTYALEDFMTVNGTCGYEAFFSDGVRSLLRYKDRIRNITEKTLRYPIHLDTVQHLSGITDNAYDPVKLEKAFSSLEPCRDLVILSTRISGANIGCSSIAFELIEVGDDTVSAMSKTTAYSCVAFATTLLEGKVERKGLLYPEDLGELGLFSFVNGVLAEQNIWINRY